MTLTIQMPCRGNTKKSVNEIACTIKSTMVSDWKISCFDYMFWEICLHYHIPPEFNRKGNRFAFVLVLIDCFIDFLIWNLIAPLWSEKTNEKDRFPFLKLLIPHTPPPAPPVAVHIPFIKTLPTLPEKKIPSIISFLCGKILCVSLLAQIAILSNTLQFNFNADPKLFFLFIVICHCNVMYCNVKRVVWKSWKGLTSQRCHLWLSDICLLIRGGILITWLFCKVRSLVFNHQI